MKIKNTSGDALTLPWLGDRLVLPGQVIEVPPEIAEAYSFPAPTWSKSKAAADHAFASPDPLDVSSQATAPNPED
jgi:hypothetical protein